MTGSSSRLARIGQFVRGLVALALVSALGGGVPYGLVRFVGWPLPRSVPSFNGVITVLGQHGISNTALVDVLSIGVWAAWAVLALAFLAEAIALALDRRAGRLPLAGHLQPFAGALLGTIVLSLAASLARPSGSGVALAPVAITTPVRPPARAARPAAPPVADAFLTAVMTNGTPSRNGADASSDGYVRYAVEPGDTLWSIAGKLLGNDRAWPIIFEDNKGILQADGRALESPHWIYPGWVLRVRVPSSMPTAPPPASSARPSADSSDTSGQPTSAAPTDPAHPPLTTAPVGPEWPHPAPSGPQAPDGASVASGHDERATGRASWGPLRLPSGSFVGGSFALGILAALALARLRRRHAYRYRPPEPGRHLGGDALRPTLRALADAVQPVGGIARVDDQRDDDRPHGGEPEDDQEAHELGSAMRSIAPAMADEDPDHRARPDLIEVGTRTDGVVSLMLSELAGVALSGRKADDVVRAWITALLVRSGPVAAELFTTEAALERLVPGAGALAAGRDLPGVRSVAGDETLLGILEGEIRARSRHFAADDAADILAYRHAYPWDPMPTVIVLAEQVSTELAPRWREAFTCGARFGVGAVVLDGASPEVTRIDLDGAGRVTGCSSIEVARLLEGVECFALQASEAKDVFASLIEIEVRPTSEEAMDADAPWGGDASDGSVADRLVLVETGTTEVWPEALIATAPKDEEPRDEEPGDEEPRDKEPRDEELGDEESVEHGSIADAPSPPITVQLFGPYEIAVGGRVINKGLRSVARELLAWYLLRPEGATIGAAVDGCWPDTGRVAVNDKFWRAAGDLRTHVGAIADPKTLLIDKVGDVYRLDVAAIDCDLWRFQSALGVAARAEDPHVARDALSTATACFGGEFVADGDYRWIEPVREDLHRRALDAHLRLAELEETLGAPDAAEAALEGAIELDRFAEEPYRRLMTLQAERGRPDAVTATWRRLQRRLIEIDVDPEHATAHLYRTLTASESDRRAARSVRLSS